MGYDRVLEALAERGLEIRNGMVRCPAHDDRRASLSIRKGDDGKALLFCFASCDIDDIRSALGLTWEDLFAQGEIAAEYVYTDEDGNPLYRVIRKRGKAFYQERYEHGRWLPGMEGVRRVLYNLPEIAKAKHVFVVEGEKDAETLGGEGYVATTNVGGSNAWSDDYKDFLKGKRVSIISDADAPGESHARRVEASLQGVARSVELLKPKTGKDVTDHFNAGFGINDLLPFEDSGIDVFEPWDPWEYEVPVDEWLLDRYIPRRSRVLLHGESGALKTLWAMWLSAKVASQGERVAFFSTEMNRGQIAKRFKQLPYSPTLKVFGRFMMGQDLGTAIRNFEGYALLVVDSWSSTQGDISANDNDAIAKLDKDFFQPLIAATGATLLILDNTGHDIVTPEGKIKRSTARGASRKRDIQEVELWFHRPDKTNNFRTKIEVTKVRLDIVIPAPVVVETPQDIIEFYYVEQGTMTSRPMWPAAQVDPDDDDGEPDIGEPAVPEPPPIPSLSPSEARALARLKDSLKAVSV